MARTSGAKGRESGPARRKGAAAPAKGGAKDSGTQKARLVKELGMALPQIDEAGLLFLLRQAQVLIHNAAVDRLNREEEVLAHSSRSTRTGAPTAPPTLPAAVTIEDPDGGKPVFLAFGRIRKVLSPEEMRRLVRICRGDGTKAEALSQLFKVLSGERRDILTDAGIAGPSSPLLERLYAAVRARYRPAAKGS